MPSLRGFGTNAQPDLGGAERRGEVAEEAPLVGDLDEGGSVAIEGIADGGAEVLGGARAAAGDAVGGGKLEEVGVIELGVEVTALVDAVLDVLDGAVGGVIMDQGEDPEAI